MRGINFRIELKYIVFLLQLLLLFGFCDICKIDDLEVDVYQVGKENVVIFKCLNFVCIKLVNIWYS